MTQYWIAENLAGLTVTILTLFSLFFWGRGMVRASNSDLIGGISILCLLVILSFDLSSSSAVFGDIGVLLMIFGAFTSIMSHFARKFRLLTQRDWVMIGVAAMVIGFVLSLTI